MYNLSRRSVLAAGVGGAAVLGLAGCGNLERQTPTDGGSAAPAPGSGAKVGKTQLKFGFAQPIEHPQCKAMIDFSDRLYDATEGRYSVEISPDQTLGSQSDVMQLMQNGTVDLATAVGGLLENLNPEFSVMNLPYCFKSAEHQMKAANDMSIVGDLYKTVEKDSLVILGAWNAGVRGMYNRLRPIHTPEDMVGMKVRVQQSEIQMGMIDALGASPTPMALGEIYTGLQQGVLDAAENNYITYDILKHYEVAKYFSETKHTIPPDYVLMGAHVFKDKITDPKDQEIFMEEYVKTNPVELKLFNEDAEASKKKTIEGGAEYNDVDEAAFEKVLEAFSTSKLSPEGKKLWDAIHAVA